MHDIRLIRDDPQAFDRGLARRNMGQASRGLLALDEMIRARKTTVQECLARRNELSKLIGQAKSQRDEQSSTVLTDQVIELKQRIAETDAEIVDYSRQLEAGLRSLPNLPLPDVPDGLDERYNQLVHERGHRPDFVFTPREHDVFGPALGLDFETGAAMSGARFTLVRGAAARLNRALGQFMLDRLTGEHGYELVSPPLLVRDEAVYGTGQLPKFAEDLFKTTDGRWLIPTAEVSLTNIVREQILTETELPLRFCALTPCFRSEAGAAGRDTRGFIRQHQFEKVEMVSIVTPDASEAEHERMTACAEGILDALGLAYRRMKLCTGDMSFTAARTYDLEVWLPGQGRYREISSCSTCTDFQARRMNTRYRPEGEPTGGAGSSKNATRFVHTLNGSGLAVGRTLVAVLENYQRADGSVTVPDVLRRYLGGAEVLEPR